MHYINQQRKKMFLLNNDLNKLKQQQPQETTHTKKPQHNSSV